MQGQVRHFGAPGRFFNLPGLFLENSTIFLLHFPEAILVEHVYSSVSGVRV